MGNELARVESKLNAILAILVDRHIRETEIARPKERSIDQLLSDVGLSSKDIAGLLGKTERAVNLQLQRGSQRKTGRKAAGPRADDPETESGGADGK